MKKLLTRVRPMPASGGKIVSAQRVKFQKTGIALVLITLFLTAFRANAQVDTNQTESIPVDTAIMESPADEASTMVNPLDAATDSLNGKIENLRSDLDILRKIKISGYIQSQFQWAEQSGINSFAGGNFAPGVDKRFSVRRGRVKVTHDNGMSQFVFQLDMTERGFVIKDAYMRFTDPWIKYFAVTAGVFNRPFGFEVPYSSSLRESPERGRMSQIIFPEERDLGASITFQPPKGTTWSFMKLEAGMFNGVNNRNTEVDLKKDFISHLTLSKVFFQEKFRASGGLSYYNGGIRESGGGVPSTVKWEEDHLHDSAGVKMIYDRHAVTDRPFARREYYGADAQFTMDLPTGLTTIRAEYITGYQPGSLTSTVSPAALPVGNVIVRKFDGAYIYFVQNLGNSRHQVVIKYDWYDPNLEAKASDIGAKGNTELGLADIKFTTWGFGWVYRIDDNVKLTLYYDMIQNEKTNFTDSGTKVDYSKDVKDNVLTARLQYRF